MHIDLEKIEQKKTKATMTLSFSIHSFSRRGLAKSEAFKRLLAIGILSGGGTNCARQVLGASDLNFDLFEKLRVKMDNLIYDAVNEIERSEKMEGIETKTHKFH